MQSPIQSLLLYEWGVQRADVTGQSGFPSHAGSLQVISKLWHLGNLLDDTSEDCKLIARAIWTPGCRDPPDGCLETGLSQGLCHVPLGYLLPVNYAEKPG